MRNKAFGIARNSKDDGYQTGLVSMVYKFFDKKSSGSGVATVSNYQLANELHREIIKDLREEMFIRLLETIFGCC